MSKDVNIVMRRVEVGMNFIGLLNESVAITARFVQAVESLTSYRIPPEDVSGIVSNMRQMLVNGKITIGDLQLLWSIADDISRCRYLDRLDVVMFVSDYPDFFEEVDAVPVGSPYDIRKQFSVSSIFVIPLDLKPL